jgi:hypothetical protein
LYCIRRLSIHPLDRFKLLSGGFLPINSGAQRRTTLEYRPLTYPQMADLSC